MKAEEMAAIAEKEIREDTYWRGFSSTELRAHGVFELANRVALAGYAAGVAEAQREALWWITGYAGPTEHDEFITRLLNALQRREEDAAADWRKEVGNVLDHWEQLPNDLRSDPGFEALNNALKKLYVRAALAAEEGAK